MSDIDKLECIFEELEKVRRHKEFFSKAEKELVGDAEKIISGLGDAPAFGTWKKEFPGLKVTRTVPKKVVWDQAALEIIHTRNTSMVDVKYSISDKVYKDATGAFRDMMEKARTETPGNPSYKIEIIEE